MLDADDDCPAELAARVPRPVIPDGVDNRAAAWRDWTAGRTALEGIGRVHRAQERRAEADGEFRSAYAITTRFSPPSAARVSALLEDS